MKHKITLQILLMSGALYFFAVSLVHFLGIKIPMLFIYFDIHSYVYQDRIISILSFVFSLFLFAGYKISKTTLEIVKYIVIAGFGAILGLVFNNFVTRLEFRNNPTYWLEIAVLAMYLICLYFFYLKAKKYDGE